MRFTKALIRTTLLTTGLAALVGASALAQEKSLYDRLGGKEAITAVVNDFAGRVLADERINKKFSKSDPARLTAMLVDQICMATGGPCKYTGHDMKRAHKNMGVTEGEFNALVEDLVATLDKFNVPEKEKGELLGILAPMKPSIVEKNSTETGTPLPDKFKPAPPLKMDKKMEKKADKER
jgi:hemoglobin